jgi:hypothetical protein
MTKLLHTTPETRYPDDIPTPYGKIQYIVCRLQRAINKVLGRPSNQQTAILAEMLARLKTAVKELLPLGTYTTHAVVTTPDSIRLTAEEVGDVLDYLNIANLMVEPEELYMASSAYAGFGYGLCKSYTQPYICAQEEELDLPYRTVLVVDFLDTALSMTIKGVRSYKTSGADATLIEHELGYGTGRSAEELEILFAELRTRMRRFLQRSRSKVTMVLLVGTRVGDRRFRDVLKDALEVHAQSSTTDNLHAPLELQSAGSALDSMFATAKGAAEVAKRRLEGPVRCVWSETCGSGKPSLLEEPSKEALKL